MADLLTLVRAYRVAAEQHRGQTRKDVPPTPYINHPVEVAAILCEVAGVEDVQVLAAAVLHDTVEDTGMTVDAIREQFGARVAALVAECTDDKSLPRAERKRLQIANASHKSAEARLIKIADKITNVTDIASADWPVERKMEYLEWAEKVVAGLRGQNAALEGMFDRALAKSYGVVRGEGDRM
jgi:GTP diphosphokinase / guanosine-3',5'-bis(diphosphate) 3'-diphosphatase